MQIFLDLIFAYGALQSFHSLTPAFTTSFRKISLLLYTYITLFRKIYYLFIYFDFYLVLEDKSSPYNIFTMIWNLSPALIEMSQIFNT